MLDFYLPLMINLIRTLFVFKKSKKEYYKTLHDVVHLENAKETVEMTDQVSNEILDHKRKLST